MLSKTITLAHVLRVNEGSGGEEREKGRNEEEEEEDTNGTGSTTEVMDDTDSLDLGSMS